MTYPHVERKHRLLGHGMFEERTYVDGLLVDTRVYSLAGERVRNGAVRRKSKNRVGLK